MRKRRLSYVSANLVFHSMEGLALVFMFLGFGAVYVLLAADVYALIVYQRSRPNTRTLLAVIAAAIWPITWPMILLYRLVRSKVKKEKIDA